MLSIHTFTYGDVLDRWHRQSDHPFHLHQPADNYVMHASLTHTHVHSLADM